MTRDHYTNYPRTILWLVSGGAADIGGREAASQPPFRVEVEPFYIGKHPITNPQYEAFDPVHVRSPQADGDRDPVTGVDWHDAVAYCRWYAGIARKPFRLPTEIEWEHACRAGEPGDYFFDAEEADAYIWHAGNSDGRLPDLEHKKTNPFGLYGMLGGVWEWTASPFRPYPLDGTEAPGRGEAMVQRGGSFRVPLATISCSLRRPIPPETRSVDTGFRIARDFHRRAQQ